MADASRQRGWDEAQRLAALDSYRVLDTPVERAFDDVVKLTSDLLQVPIAAVNLIASGRQWFKSEIGLGVREMPLEDSICRHALLEEDRMIVPDTTLDARFRGNPLVTGGPGLRFYAGELLKTPEGLPLGTLCVLDSRPRPQGLTPQQAFALRTLAHQVMTQLELRKLVHEQRELLRQQQATAEELRRERDRAYHLFQGMDEGFVFLDPEYRIREINPGGLRMDGRAVHEVVGLTHWEAWPGSETLPVADAIRRSMVERQPAMAEQLYVFPDGRRFWLDMRAFPAEGGLAIFYRDITERKEAERRLRETAERLDAVLEAAPVGIVVADRDGALLQANAENRRLWGTPHPLPNGEADAEPWRAWWADGSARTGQPLAPEDWAMRRALTGDEAPRQIIEVETFHQPRQRRIILNSGAPIRDAAGEIVGAVVAQLDISERVRAEEALREADRRKDEFLAMLAHELRNPLAPISSAAHLLSSGRVDAQRAQRLAAIVSRQARHMTALVEDLLDVSRVTRGLVQLEMEVVDAKEVIADAVEQVKPLVERHAHALSVQLGAEPALLEGDRKRLVQIVANLLNNAAKYTPNGGAIAVRLEIAAEDLKITVRDNGIGMPPELLSSAFELFTQAERSPDRSQGGLGIGLALVRSLARLHGGEVRGHSDGPDQGSTFEVTLPRRMDAPPAPQASQGHAATAAGTALRVLLVDDNEDAASTLGVYLETCGYEVTTCHSSQVALQIAPQFRPDVALLDIGLPGMDGYALARRLRALPESAGAVLMALTGYGQESDRAAALAAGFDHHLVKPVDLERLQWLLAQTAEQPRRHGGSH